MRTGSKIMSGSKYFYNTRYLSVVRIEIWNWCNNEKNKSQNIFSIINLCNWILDVFRYGVDYNLKPYMYFNICKHDVTVKELFFFIISIVLQR